MTFSTRSLSVAFITASVAGVMCLFVFSVPVSAQQEGQTLCGYVGGGFWGAKFMVSGTTPPCPTIEEAYSNPLYGGSTSCSEPGNLLPICVEDKWFWVDNVETNPPDDPDPEPEPIIVTATLTANPESIEQGDESLLTWSSTNATSCTGDGFETGGATSGSVSVSPNETTYYVVTCTDGAVSGSGEWVLDDSRETDISDLYCGPGMIRPNSANNTNVYGGMPTCPSSSPEGTSCAAEANKCKWNSWGAGGSCNVYTDVYTCTNTGESGDEIHSASDSATVTVTAASDLSATCSVSPAEIAQGESATWTAVANGGTGTYAYLWSGTDALSGTTMTVTKQYLTPGEKSAQVQVTSGDQIVTVPCDNNLTVTSAALPNLQADNVTFTPSNPNTDSATTLRAVIRNVTAVGTSVGFKDQFQINKGVIPVLDSDIDTKLTYDSSALPGNGSNTASVSYTFPSSGNWYVRACADRTTSGASPYTIVETVETDNCSNGWTLIDVGGPEDDALSCDFDYTDTDGDGRLDPYEDVVFSATPSNLGSSAYTWDPSNGPEAGGESSTFDYEFTQKGTYQVDVSATGYEEGTCTVNVVDPLCTGVSCDCVAGDLTLSASPSRVVRGETSALTYSIEGVEGGVTQCTIRSDKDTSYVRTITINSCNVEKEGTEGTHAIQTQTTFTLRCGTITTTTTVDIVPDIIEI